MNFQESLSMLSWAMNLGLTLHVRSINHYMKQEEKAMSNKLTYLLSYSKLHLFQTCNFFLDFDTVVILLTLRSECVDK